MLNQQFGGCLNLRVVVLRRKKTRFWLENEKKSRMGETNFTHIQASMELQVGISER